MLGTNERARAYDKDHTGRSLAGCYSTHINYKEMLMAPCR